MHKRLAILAIILGQASSTLAFVSPALRILLRPSSAPAVSSRRCASTGARLIAMSATSPRALDVSCVVEPTSGTHDSTVIFLHGSGDSGEGVREWVQSTMGSFEFARTRIVFPTAPMRKYH